MVVTFEEIVIQARISQKELSSWIEQRWVLPTKDGERYLFDEADRARITLIAELRRDFDVNDEAVPVVLKLLDQVYSLRQRLSELQQAIELLPEEAREQLDHLIRDATKT